ncbi:MAG TPA: glycosyl hydrolase-related protein, partial [Acidobacteriaceae bacterium]
FSMRLPQVLARSGVGYLITGSNIAFGGGTSLTPGRMPIYWRSPDGSRVLMWQTQGKNGGYTEAMADYYIDPDARDPYQHTKFYPKEWEGLSNLEIMQRGIQKLLAEYAAAGYQHSAAALLYMHDGIGPEYELHGLIPNVRAWNAVGRSPRLVIATPAEFFAAMEHEKGFPTYTGDWSGLWSAVKLNSPAMSADARWLQEELPHAETLWSIVSYLRPDSLYPASAISADYRKLFFYDEHNGSGQGGWPKLLSHAEVLEQNQQYAGYLQSARTSVTDLLAAGMTQLASEPRAAAGKQLVLVYNPMSWSFSGLSRLTEKGSYTIRDASSGQEMKTQRDGSGVTYFEVHDLPPLGYRTYIVEPGRTASAGETATVSTLRSPFFEVELDGRTGEITKITDRRTHHIVCDEQQGDFAGRLMRDPGNHLGGDFAGAVVLHHERGPLFDRVRIERPGSYWPQTIISLPRNQPRIDLSEMLDRAKMPFVSSRDRGARYSFGFSFFAANGSQRLVSNGDELYRFPEDLLPGAKKDAVVPRHTLVWSTQQGSHPYQLLLAQQQSFYDELPLKPCRTSVRDCPPGLRVVVMLKSDQAETRDQGVVTFPSYEPGYSTRYTYNFSLTASPGEPDPVAAQHFQAQDTLVSVVLPPGLQPRQWSQSLLSVNAPNVIVQALKPSLDDRAGDMTLRLREIAGRDTTVSLHSVIPINRISETTMTEDKELKTGLSQQAIRLTAYQTLTLRLTTGASAKGPAQ